MARRALTLSIVLGALALAGLLALILHQTSAQERHPGLDRSVAPAQQGTTEGAPDAQDLREGPPSPQQRAVSDTESSAREDELIAEFSSLGELFIQLASPDMNERLAAVQKLAESRSPLAINPLIEALKDPSFQVRAEAARALGERGDMRAVEPLIAALKYEESWVRGAAAYALGTIGDPRAFQPLAEALNDPRLYLSAMNALVELRDDRAVDLFVKLLEDGHWWRRESAAYFLKRKGWSPANLQENLYYLVASRKFDEAASIGYAALPSKEGDTSAEGLLVFDLPIVLSLTAGTGESPDVVKTLWVDFRMDDGQVHPRLVYRLMSWPKSKWLLSVDLLHDQGQSLGRVERQVENSGKIISLRHIDGDCVDFPPLPAHTLSKAAGFRLSVEQVIYNEESVP